MKAKSVQLLYFDTTLTLVGVYSMPQLSMRVTKAGVLVPCKINYYARMVLCYENIIYKSGFPLLTIKVTQLQYNYIFMTQPQSNLNPSDIIELIKAVTCYSDAKQLAAKIIAIDRLQQVQLAKKIEYKLADPQNTLALQVKINIFETMAALSLTEQKHRFLKHFVPRIIYFLKKYSIRISDSNRNSKRVMQVFKKWEEAKLFCPSFYTKLRGIANSIYFYNVEQKGPVFTKYNKTFLCEYRDVWKVELTKILYDSHQIKVAGEQQFKTLKSQYSDLHKTGQNSNQKKQKAAELKIKVQQTIEKLMKSLKLNKKGFRLLQQMLQKQKQGLEFNTKEEYIAGKV